MTTQTPPKPAAYRSALARGGDGFVRLLHAEWTKLRTVRRWTIVMLSAVAVTILVSTLSAGGDSVSGGGGGAPPRGPDGTRVVDAFQFVGQPLAGDGTVTARVTGLTRDTAEEDDRSMTLGGGKPAPWAKAGVIVKASTTPGSTYAAMMLTQSHGVRFQTDFTVDRAGSSAPPSSPRWLRLTRAGNVVTGYESADGVVWDKVGSATLEGLPASAEVGLFVTSPGLFAVERQFGSTSVEGGPSSATGTFDGFSVDGRTEGPVRGVDVGAPPRGPRVPGAPDRPDGPAGEGPGPDGPGNNTASESGGVHTLTASGDIAPMESETDLAQRSLEGAMIGLIPLAALGVLFITAEYRKGMILTTFTASPRRGRVLAAKALVLGTAAFAVGLVASVASFLIGQPLLRSSGLRPPQFPEPSLGDGRVFAAVVGTAGVLALVAVFAMALGALLRNTAAAVSVIIVLLVLPQILLSGLPLDAARFIMQATPVAGFAVQRTTDDFGQVDSACIPEDGCYPQAPWAGFGVLLLYTLAALALAAWRIRRRAA
ncbi:ABC transporter permease subunit [Streptodolium elevatio]